MRPGYPVVLSVLIAVAVVAPAALAGVKPSSAQSGELLERGMGAITAVHLVEQRGCRYRDIPCMRRATLDEAKAFVTAAASMRKVAGTLSAGACKTALLKRAAGYEKHASLVTRAFAAWSAAKVDAGAKLYYAEWNPDGILDANYLQHCQ